ncbi:hypothetical protein BZG36_03621 [Bifiguratus adelaidae]|uniref:Pinin/SDK/MemA protein domain-containing protein n=1 Tax=Bifiguratus adelaidae TaxID=1938954 RepID=A0A261Y093_9FUNG|nr:hypothetical protein BZG36_03621 [Bifiguratus adelaidae]
MAYRPTFSSRNSSNTLSPDVQIGTPHSTTIAIDDFDSSHNQQHSWEYLRKQARTLENEVETEMSAFSRIASQANKLLQSGKGGDGLGEDPAEPLIGNELAERRVDELLNKLSLIISSMTEYLDRPSGHPTSPSMLHMLQRHKDILYDYNKEFRRIKATVKAAKDHWELMRSVHGESRSYIPNGSVSDYMLTERSRIDNSHHMTDMVLEQAYATREDLNRQRATIVVPEGSRPSTKRGAGDENGLHDSTPNNDSQPKKPRMSDNADLQKRSKRMFGVLLGTLNKFKDETSKMSEAAQKRKDLEARLADKLQKDREELHEQKVATAEYNLRTAHFLKTTTEPALYYLPKALSQDMDDKLTSQIQQATAAYEDVKQQAEKEAQEAKEEAAEDSPKKDTDSVSEKQVATPQNPPADPPITESTTGGDDKESGE